MQKMIIVQLNGGLGNQMFQYAVGRNLSYSLNTELKLDISQFPRDKLREYSLSIFNIKQIFASPRDMNRIKRPLAWKVKHPVKTLISAVNLDPPIMHVKEREFNFDHGIQVLPNDIFLEGYWQSEKYFKNIEPLIREEFTLKPVLGLNLRDLSEKIRYRNSVSIHIRRGDYIINPVTNETHGICSADYYQRAIKKIAQSVNNPYFVFFSDDPVWVKENMIIEYPWCCASHNNSKDYEDMFLMSLCKHHIIANSSFSWWGAWLCTNPKKIIIAPAKWFNKPNIPIDDIIPESWIKLS